MGYGVAVGVGVSEGVGVGGRRRLERPPAAGPGRAEAGVGRQDSDGRRGGRRVLEQHVRAVGVEPAEPRPLARPRYLGGLVHAWDDLLADAPRARRERGPRERRGGRRQRGRGSWGGSWRRFGVAIGVGVGVGVSVGVGVAVGVGVGVGMSVAVGTGVGVGRAPVSTTPTVGGAESHAASARSVRASNGSGREETCIPARNIRERGVQRKRARVRVRVLRGRGVGCVISSGAQRSRGISWGTSIHGTRHPRDASTPPPAALSMTRTGRSRVLRGERAAVLHRSLDSSLRWNDGGKGCEVPASAGTTRGGSAHRERSSPPADPAQMQART